MRLKIPKKATPFQKTLIQRYTYYCKISDKLPAWLIEGLKIHNLLVPTNTIQEFCRADLYWTSLKNIEISAHLGENLNYPNLPSHLHEAFYLVYNPITIVQCYLKLITHGLSHFNRHSESNYRLILVPYEFIINALDINDTLHILNSALTLLYFIRSFGYQYSLASWFSKKDIKKEEEYFKTRLLHSPATKTENWSLRNVIAGHFLDLRWNNPLSLQEFCRKK